MLFLVSCRSNKVQSDNIASKNTVVTYLDSLSASKAIVEEDEDGFFDKISIIDMAIKLKSEKNMPAEKKLCWSTSHICVQRL